MKPIRALSNVCINNFKFYSTARYLLCLLFLLNHFPLNAQFNEDNFKKVSIEIDGEEVFNVYEITQDHQGFMWMATNLGLIRYDGLEGKKYNNIEGDSSSSDYDDIESIYVDSKGDLWVGAQSSLSRYNPDCDCLYEFPAIDYNTSLTRISSIAEDKNNNIWISTWNGGLFQFDRASKSFTKFLHLPSDPISLAGDNISKLLVDQNNNLWIGTNSNKKFGLIRYNINTGDVEQFSHDPADPNSLIDNRISALYEDRQGQILIGTYKAGFHIYNPKNGSLKRISYDADKPGQIHAPYSEGDFWGNDPLVRLIHQGQNGDYWISTTGKGINHFSGRTGAFKNYDFDLVNPQALWSFYEDRQGIIWIGGQFGSGLFKADPLARTHDLNTNFASVESAYETSYNPGIVWVKSLLHGLGKLNLETNEITRYMHDKDHIERIGSNWVRSAYQENERTLWLGLGTGGPYGGGVGDGGIDRMDIETGTFTHFKLTRDDDGRGDFSYTVYSICEDSEGRLWMGTGPGGVFRSDKEKKIFEHFHISNNLDPGRKVYLNIVRIDSNGDIWASEFKGEGTLYQYDRQGETFNPYLKGFKMYDILVDRQGKLVISTYEKGLVHLDPNDGSYIQYTKKDGLPSIDALDICAGNEDIVWVGTRVGPAKFNTKTGEISPIGLPKVRYNTGVFKASDGRIYLGTNKGLASFHPRQIKGNPYPPQIAIRDLLISEKNYLAGNNHSDELSFAHNQNDITFKYIGLHFSDPAKNLYQYKLEPLNDNWIDARFERTARFFNLQPGTYNFVVKAANSDGVWSEKTASMRFTIKPAWWNTWWAYAIYFITLAFLAYRIYHFQLSRRVADSERKRLQEVNQLKNTLFTNITHEFRTPLTVIKGMTDSIKSDLENSQYDDLGNSLEMIDRNSDGLLHLVNEMLDLAKLESGNMELQLVQSDVIPFIKYVSESFSSLTEENQVGLTVYSEMDSLIMDFDVDKLTSVISNLLSNAVKFTPEFGKIIVHINQITKADNPYLSIKIKDSGIGISSEELPNIFTRFYQADASSIRQSEGTGIGLALTKELVELMNGTIEAKSTLAKGSEFSIMLPVSRNAPVSENIHIGKVPQALVAKAPIISEPSLDPNSELPLALIIEDNTDVAHYLKTCLVNKYETIHAMNGLDGIETALDKIPDIIISDVMMPGKDGFEVCETLKSDERTDHIPIIMLTAKATLEDRLTGLSYGADAYLAKPFNKEELFIRLDQLVSVRKKLISKLQKDGFSEVLKESTKDPKLQFLQKVEKLIQEELDNSDFASGDLAKKLLISDSQLYRKIKAITGRSTAVFIRSIRLRSAKELLATTNKTVSEAAYETGFNDPSWFSRAFKDEFGFSP